MTQERERKVRDWFRGEMEKINKTEEEAVRLIREEDYSFKAALKEAKRKMEEDE